MYVIVLAITALLAAIWGWRKGAMRVVTRLLVLVLAYALTWQETPALVHFITEKHWLTGVVVWPVASGALFVGGSVMFSLCAAGIYYLAPDEWKHGGKSAGAILGAVLGGVLGLFLVWTVGVTQDAIAKRQQAGTDTSDSASTTAQNRTAAHTAPDNTVNNTRSAADQFLYDFAANSVSSVLTSIMGNSPSAALAGQMLRSPLSVGEGFKHLAEQPALRLLIQDPQSYFVLKNGSVADVMRLPYFRELVSDAELMRFLTSAGLAGTTAAEQEQDFATKLSTYARNFEQVRLTPEYQALASDPNFQAQLKSGQWIQLLGNEKARALAEMLINPDTVASQPAAAGKPTGFTMQAPGQTTWSSNDDPNAGATGDETGESSVKPIYRWRDANGRIHITDTKPPDGIEADVLVE